jgi:SAM-dependent methyltransferase
VFTNLCIDKSVSLLTQLAKIALRLFRSDKGAFFNAVGRVADTSMTHKYFEKLRKLWIRTTLSNVHRSGANYKLALAYLMKDPWNLGSSEEALRFQKTNKIFEEVFGHVNTLLEIGCGEGLQSAHLQKLCNELTGIDVVPRAINRAILALPNAKFLVGDIGDVPWSQQLQNFDAVVAFEVLLYVKDVEQAIARMNRLGRACMISCYEQAVHHIEPALEKIPNVSRRVITAGDKRWVVAWWKSG